MARYIEADNPHIPSYFTDYQKAAFLSGLILQPDADVAEVKHGYWKSNGRCSCCDAFSVSHGSDYCSNCGAKMDKGCES